MAFTEIRYFAGYRIDAHLIQGEEILERETMHGPDALKEGQKRFDEILEERAGWLLQASMRRDFEDNMTIDITCRIGPEPFWSEEYLKEHNLGKYALL